MLKTDSDCSVEKGPVGRQEREHGRMMAYGKMHLTCILELELEMGRWAGERKRQE